MALTFSFLLQKWSGSSRSKDREGTKEATASCLVCEGGDFSGREGGGQGGEQGVPHLLVPPCVFSFIPPFRGRKGERERMKEGGGLRDLEQLDDLLPVVLLATSVDQVDGCLSIRILPAWVRPALQQ